MNDLLSKFGLQESSGRASIVDWDQVFAWIHDQCVSTNSVISFKEITNYITSTFPEKKQVYYTELTRVLETWKKNKKGYVVFSGVKHDGTRRRRYVGVFTQEELQKLQKKEVK